MMGEEESMVHHTIGNIGHLCIIISFVSSLTGALSYYKAKISQTANDTNEWAQIGRIFFYVHLSSILASFTCLFIIVFNYYFEYHYTYSHASKQLPLHYLISCVWEGQEGSFMLWICYQGLLGLVIIHKHKKWENATMVVYNVAQAFLVSMILGIVIPWIDLKLGSSPFILLRDMSNDSIFKLNPNFIPADGAGLNPLLQNYWMVIHPPTLFLGFATTLPLFALCIASLWQKEYMSWIQEAIPWTIFGAAILGLGIMMGGYWAYETLSFGGYWNWDPVENAVYVPWIILIATIHAMISYRQTKKFLKTTIVLSMAVFILILYSSFLTRSGILGDASVHAFTDLGLSGQLLVYTLFFLILAVIALVSQWRHIPSSQKEASTYSKEFWIFIGIVTLCFTSFQVLIPTSIPVYNKLLDAIGYNSNLAPPADPVELYSKFQIWFGIAIAMFSAIAQFFHWRKTNMSILRREIVITTMISLIIFCCIVVLSNMYTISYLILTFSCVYTIVVNFSIIKKTIFSNITLSGGAVAHIGVGIMLIGILFSSGYANVVSINNTGLLISKNLTDEVNRNNLILFVNEPKEMNGQQITFLGERLAVRNYSNRYIDKSNVHITTDPTYVIATENIVHNGSKWYQPKDTIPVEPENIYYEIEMEHRDGTISRLFPRLQHNPSMGTIASPDIQRKLTSDLFTHVSFAMSEDEPVTWDNTDSVRLKIGEQFFVNDYVATLESISQIDSLDYFTLHNKDVAVKAVVRIEGERKTYYAYPVFIISDTSRIGRIATEINDLGIKITLLNIHPEDDEFSLKIDTRQKDWVVIKAIKKPLINILWIGIGILILGFFIALKRRLTFPIHESSKYLQ